MFLSRRIRSLVGIGVVWGGAVSAIGTTFILVAFATGWISSAPGFGPLQWMALAARVAARNFLLGGFAGVAFAMLLAGAERRRTLESLPLVRVGGWGFLASAVPTGIVGILSGARIPPATLAAGTIAAGFLGVGLSIGMIRLARRSRSAASSDPAASLG